MSIYIENADVFSRWSGEAIDGIRYPQSISSKWSDSELESIGLYRPEPADPVPDGKVAISSSVQRVDGVVKWVHELADAPEPEPHFPPLTARQLRLGLIAAGISIASVNSAIAAIEDATDREVATVEWEYASQFERDHHLIEMIGGALGMSPEQIDAAWTNATTL